MLRTKLLNAVLTGSIINLPKSNGKHQISFSLFLTLNTCPNKTFYKFFSEVHQNFVFCDINWNGQIYVCTRENKIASHQR